MTKETQKKNAKPNYRKKKQTSKKQTNKKIKVGSKNHSNNSQEELTINSEEYKKYKSFKKYTKEDRAFDKYKNKEEFKQLAEANPSIFVVNKIFLDVYNKSFLDLLFKEENSDFVDILTYYLHLKKLTTGSKGEYPVLELLIAAGFNTIYDVLLENKKSFYLLGFLMHIGAFGVIEDPNAFLVSLKKSDLHDKLRNIKIIEQLQNEKLYTRIKSQQL